MSSNSSRMESKMAGGPGSYPGRFHGFGRRAWRENTTSIVHYSVKKRRKWVPQVWFVNLGLGVGFRSAEGAMPAGLRRYYGKSDLHFITFRCYRRLPQLKSAKARDVFVRIDAGK